jgi:hypothetical protein
LISVLRSFPLLTNPPFSAMITHNSDYDGEEYTPRRRKRAAGWYEAVCGGCGRSPRSPVSEGRSVLCKRRRWFRRYRIRSVSRPAGEIQVVPRKKRPFRPELRFRAFFRGVSRKVCWCHSTFRRGRSRTARNVEKSELFRAIHESPLRSIWFANTLPDYHLLLSFPSRS